MMAKPEYESVGQHDASHGITLHTYRYGLCCEETSILADSAMGWNSMGDLRFVVGWLFGWCLFSWTNMGYRAVLAMRQW
jgi:hypothetical protein